MYLYMIKNKNLFFGSNDKWVKIEKGYTFTNKKDLEQYAELKGLKYFMIYSTFI